MKSAILVLFTVFCFLGHSF